MPYAVPSTTLQLQSLLKSSGELQLSLVDVPLPALGPDEVLVRVDATPLNPSDQGLLFGPADLSKAVVSGTAERPVVTAPVAAAAMPAQKARIDKPMPVGNEGAGEVVAAGEGGAAQALLGRKVAMMGGAMYAQHRRVKSSEVLVLPQGATARDGASSFINPLTALGMVETMRDEGHRALVHTAAASNLGQMLLRICQEDGIELVNIVRRDDQAALLRQAGATHVCVSTSESFDTELAEAMAATGATIAFDAIGGGTLPAQILTAMEKAITRTSTTYNRYGSDTHKQVYLYGSLDLGPTIIERRFGMSWGIGGWLVFPRLARLVPDTVARLKARVMAELTTTFASHYSREVSLAEALSPEAIAAYGRRATGEKFLIVPSKGLV